MSNFAPEFMRCTGSGKVKIKRHRNCRSVRFRTKAQFLCAVDIMVPVDPAAKTGLKLLALSIDVNMV